MSSGIRVFKILLYVPVLIVTWFFYQNCGGMDPAVMSSLQQSSEIVVSDESPPPTPTQPPPGGSVPALFSENYEIAAGDVSQGNVQYNNLIARGWDIVSPNCTGYCSMSIVPGPFGRTGNVLRYEYRSDQDNEPIPAQDAHNSNLIKVFNPPVSELWGRVDFATDVDTNANPLFMESLWFCCGTKLHYIKPVGAGPSYLLGSAYPANPGGLMSIYATQEMAVCPQGGTPTYKNGNGCNNVVPNVTPIIIRDKKWYCVEYHIKLNSAYDKADGAIEVWVDNTKVLNMQNQLMVDGYYTLQNARIGQIEVYRQHANHMYRYEDNLKWSTTRIGCGG